MDKSSGMNVDPLALAHRRPDLSASVPILPGQKIVMIAVSLALMALSVLRPWQTAQGCVMLATAFYLLFTFYKLLLVRLSVVSRAEIRIAPAELAGLKDADLPVYSILVPLYHEPESLPGLVQSLVALDYPDHRKDVQLLLEEDDAATREAAARLTLPRGFRVTVVPKSFPRTKPKACNIGLAQARGEYLVIYDAEDRPEPDQLRKAVAGFRRAGPDVICLQCRLNFYNPRFNLLTRWFTAEYSAWFDLSLPGLSAMNAVIPLGGTSNHFVTRKLEELMGWDAYNVTEDCDLGVRIYRAGYRSRMLATTTWEEACGSLPFWIRQRTRWLKGYIQTYLVHMRRPWRLLRDLGPANFMHFQMLIGGIVFCFLINPLFWFLALLWFTLRLEILADLFPGLVFVGGALCLFAGNFAFAYIGAIGCYQRGYYDLVKYALLAPAYWTMMSYSGWRACFQFFSNPFHWEKTRHGLSTGNQT
ncbi:MAG: glycosyltransferase [Lentisphaerae bacterium]|nr:glycosyltransferase [Lentisphaerota bacterium]